MSGEDLSDLPAVPPDELRSDETAAKSLTSQTSKWSHVPRYVSTVLIGCWRAMLGGGPILDKLLVRIKTLTLQQKRVK